jgi:hypothetical protein
LGFSYVEIPSDSIADACCFELIAAKVTPGYSAAFSFFNQFS